MLHHFGPLTRTELGTVYRGPLRQVGNSSDAPAREWWGFLDSENRDGTARKAPSSGAWWRVCRPDDDGKDVKHGEAADADEEPSNGRRGYTVQWRQQGQRLSNNTPPLDRRHGYTVQQW